MDGYYFEGIYLLLMFHDKPQPSDFFLGKTTEKTALGSTLSLENGVVGGKESYLLLLKCCKPCFAIYARNKQLLEACDNPEWLALGHIHKEYHQNMYQI